MRNALAIISGLISVVASLPYILDTFRGKTRPNIVTWLTWGSLSAITSFAVLSDHAVQTAIFAGAMALSSFTIALVGLRYGLKRYTLFDIICQILAIIGIILWQVTSQPGLAVLFVIISGLVGALPTYRHIWLQPKEETLPTFVAYFIAELIAITSLANFRFVASGYPIYMALSSVSLIGLILFCRQRNARLERA